MIPLIAHTPRLTLIAASRALLIAELQKPRYFPVLLGAEMPADWPPGEYDRSAAEYFLEQLTAGGRVAAGWYGWYAIRKVTPNNPATLIGAGGFLGPPDASGTAEIGYSISTDWRGQGLGTELVAGLITHAAQTGMVRRLMAYTQPDNIASQQVLLRNGFEPAPTAPDGRPGFARTVEPVVPEESAS
ncbi:Protein N-acetyltransferase, RimJ/RimL family [Hymenobacter daecheongensis DSM 21074]|uniref:Protein N-acetyltransferase, RimJ/RimL family n=1 Tax=Hymenobacter daecheongensis DSM 21074 TaxID=1121955 RepID=A0A1M6AQT9_9BACT|nr:GNAT family N-acetyltransferase [Hymenobacter daecheongensis]SHI38889.1 Protein N-acetyltransferase, RimJ/RimL family [Hymenobacter daecheongensis DSM 21074]